MSEPTYRTPRPNRIEASDGFAVEIVDRSVLCYSEGGRDVEAEIEFLVGPVLLVVYGNSMRPRASRGAGRLADLDSAERVRISENIRRAFRSQGAEIKLG